MKQFLSVYDISDLKAALAEAAYVKLNPYSDQELGKNKTIILIFFNSSLRTRLSTQKAAMNLGMNVMVLDINKDGFKLSFQAFVKQTLKRHMRWTNPLS